MLFIMMWWTGHNYTILKLGFPYIEVCPSQDFHDPALQYIFNNLKIMQIIVGRTLLFYEDPPILPTPLFQILSTPLFSTPPHCSFVVLFLWLNGWLCHIWRAVLLDNIVDLHMLSLGNLVPEGPCRDVSRPFERPVYWFGYPNNTVQVLLFQLYSTKICLSSDQ